MRGIPNITFKIQLTTQNHNSGNSPYLRNLERKAVLVLVWTVEKKVVSVIQWLQNEAAAAYV